MSPTDGHRPSDSVPRITSLVAYGDCNTLGYRACEHNAYPERVADRISAAVLNLGRTMATTRELLGYAKDFPPARHSLAIINYGLVDSWLTFRHSPYVLYYPDNFIRKTLRIAVKKIKRLCTRSGIAKRLGPANVVPPHEFEQNIVSIIRGNRGVRFVLLSIFPNLDEARNPAILAYNEILAEIAARNPESSSYIDLYDALFERRGEFFCEDGTHINDEGHDFVANAIVEALQETARSADIEPSITSGRLGT